MVLRQITILAPLEEVVRSVAKPPSESTIRGSNSKMRANYRNPGILWAERRGIGRGEAVVCLWTFLSLDEVDGGYYV